MNRIQFKVNGKNCSVGNEVSSEVTLLDYLRKHLDLRGTKYMCKEGGCGACTVTAVRSPGSTVQAINSCLVSITSCKDWDITTIEEVGNKLKGYSDEQKALAENNGTQCGFCSPGWVMTMHSLLESKKQEDITELEVEKYFSGNICRCTGYRPIMTAFKSFAKAKDDNLTDIEDLSIHCKNARAECRKSSCESHDWCFVEKVNDEEEDDVIIMLELKDGRKWYTVYKVKDVFDVLTNNTDKSYMLVNGNTAKGAYPILEYPDILIDISRIQEIKDYSIDQNLNIGAGNTLKETMDIFTIVAKEEYFEYLLLYYEHLELVANTGVRNIGTLGGNLMTKHIHNDFPSDVFLILETCGGIITTQSADGKTEQNTPESFLSIDMKNKIIINVMFPPLNKKHKIKTYKIMPRSQNAVARVNAGFIYKLDDDEETVIKATVVYGGINANFIHAKNTESFLVGKKLFKNKTLQGALEILSKELKTEGITDTIKKAKKNIALGLFYKGLLTLCSSDKIKDEYKSGTINLYKTRPVSKATQVYDTNTDLWPLNQPLQKVEALIQCAGEAPYADDIPTMTNEVYAAFVLSTVALGEIEDIDPKPALDIDGVLAFYDVKDIPGRNTFTPVKPGFFIINFEEEEELLCDHTVKFNGQPIGVIVAKSENLAEKAAKLVKIKYKNVKKPLLDVKKAKEDDKRTRFLITLPAIDRGLLTTKVIKGTTMILGQYHFHMEKQVSVTKPIDDGIDLTSSTQWLDVIQVAASLALNIPTNAINQTIRRLGGAFGSKISRSAQVAIICSLVTMKMNRPCRMILPMQTNMKCIGSRAPSYTEFEAGVDSSGVIQYVNVTLYEDYGYIINEVFTLLGIQSIANCYKKRWNFTGYDVTTDKARSCWMRAPGDLEVLSMAEIIMERITYELSLDPVEMRLKNLDDELLVGSGAAVREITEKLSKLAEYDKRKELVKKFNKENRWKKRGLRFAPMRWSTKPYPNNMVTLTVNHGDASVTITTGAIEMGQGLNTKVVQLCAYNLKISVDKVKVKATNSITGANTFATGSSLTSEVICYGVIKCCEEIKTRLDPVRLSHGDAEWEELVNLAYHLSIDLFVSHQVTFLEKPLYDVCGAAFAEVEVDILTGEIQVLRVDLMEDVGQSLNPSIDIGQIEGAFIMAQGYWTTEELIYNEKNGKLLTDRSWNYHVPLARDIPQDFNVYMEKNKYNLVGVYGSKATGEPAMCLGICVAFAIREAIAAARLDCDIPTTCCFDINGAHTLDKIIVAIDTDIEHYLYD